jgi:hypothetical protein
MEGSLPATFSCVRLAPRCLNPTNGGIARVLQHGDATALLECRQAGRAVPQRSGKDGADCSGTTAEARRSE